MERVSGAENPLAAGRESEEQSAPRPDILSRLLASTWRTTRAPTYSSSASNSFCLGQMSIAMRNDPAAKTTEGMSLRERIESMVNVMNSAVSAKSKPWI